MTRPPVPGELRAGDVFCASDPSSRLLGAGIRLAEKIWSHDNKAEYGHSGIIADESGTTLEALWTFKSQNLFKAYKGKNLLIARPLVDSPVKEAAIAWIKKEAMDDRYPWWRLGLHLLGPLAKVGFTGRLVCSEWTAKYLWYLQIRHGQYRGTNPDTLADEWIEGRRFDIVFKGVL